MKVILKPRQSGKTTEIIKEAAKDFSYIVCEDPDRCQKISAMAKGLDLDIPFPITYREFIDGRFYGNGVRGFVIDNTDSLLRQIARGVSIGAISITQDE